jgi:hypothetical protein
LVKTLLKWYWTVRELMLTGGRQLAAQPFAVEQVGAGQLRPELGAAEPVDRFAVERPDGLTLAQQRL